MSLGSKRATKRVRSEMVGLHDIVAETPPEQSQLKATLMIRFTALEVVFSGQATACGAERLGGCLTRTAGT